MARSIRGFGFGRPARRPQQHAEIAVRIRMTGIERNRALVGGNRVVELALRLEDDAQIAVAIRAVGHEGEAPLDERDALVAAALLMGEHACVMQRVGIVGRDLEDRAVQLLRLGELLVLLQEDGDHNRLPERQFAGSTALSAPQSALGHGVRSGSTRLRCARRAFPLPPPWR